MQARRTRSSPASSTSTPPRSTRNNQGGRPSAHPSPRAGLPREAGAVTLSAGHVRPRHGPPGYSKGDTAMTAYVIRRVIIMIPVLIVVSVITFALMHLTPGGPFDQEEG